MAKPSAHQVLTTRSAQMPSPPIEVFLTTIASQPALRQRQEYILRILQVKKIPFTSYDLASNEDAKKLWKRKAPLAKQQLPGILVGGIFPGTYEELEEAVEYDELDSFLRRKETWDEGDQDTPSLEFKPIGVPGASSPSQMTSHKPSFASAPSPVKGKSKSVKELDAESLLEDTSLRGVSVTGDDLAALVKELGLDGDEAGELVKGLSSAKEAEPKPVSSIERKADVPAPAPAPAEETNTYRNDGDEQNIVTMQVRSDRDLTQASDEAEVKLSSA